MNRRRLFVATLVIWSGLGLWPGCAVRDPELKLPCGLTGLRWGLSEAEFKTVRPRAVWNDSLEAYHEDIDTCLPFLEDAGYKFSRRRLWWRATLESVSLGRELHHTTPEEVGALVPGFVGGAVSMWGEPNGVEVFTRPKFEGTEYWNVGLWWTSEWGQVYSYYSSPMALPKFGDDQWASLAVYVSREGGDDFRTWAQGVSDPEMVGRHFKGVPTPAAAQGAVLH